LGVDVTSLSSFGAESPLGKQWAAARPDLDTSPTEVIAPVRQAFALLNAALEPLYETAPLSAPELDVLIHLRYAEEPMIARRLAQLLGVSPAAVSKSLVKLERRGFIRREPNPADRRAVRITATEAGAAAADDLFPRQLAVEARLLEGLGEDRATVVEALRTLTEVLGRAR
jgi:DNA-binding MarR family transcriptional regulator